MAHSDFWIVHPFNAVFDLMLLFFALLLIFASLLLRKKEEKTRETVLIVTCLVTTVFFFWYKYMLSLDREFNVLTADMGGFNWWGELPLHMCNINMLLIPVAVLRKSRPMQSFCFFLGPLGALMALVMPSNGFEGYSLFLPRMLGFYITHCMVIIEGLALAAFGLFRPRFRDLPRAALAAMAIAFGAFLVSMLLRLTGLHPKANYFFSVETEGNPILELFHRWLPFPFLYLIPCNLILLPYMLLVTALFALADKRKGKKKLAASK
ncbi:MAG: YwaF family protein [Oscillospiraceae bacterium]|nr:YwaF family protein [Oscillospiraceae bacterium]